MGKRGGNHDWRCVRASGAAARGTMRPPSAARAGRPRFAAPSGWSNGPGRLIPGPAGTSHRDSREVLARGRAEKSSTAGSVSRDGLRRVGKPHTVASVSARSMPPCDPMRSPHALGPPALPVVVTRVRSSKTGLLAVWKPPVLGGAENPAHQGTGGRKGATPTNPSDSLGGAGVGQTPPHSSFTSALRFAHHAFGLLSTTPCDHASQFFFDRNGGATQVAGVRATWELLEPGGGHSQSPISREAEGMRERATGRALTTPLQ